MTLEYTKVTFAVSLLAMCAVGFGAGVTSVGAWTVLIGLALLPPIFMMRVWSDPPQTMFESIQEARR